MSNNKSYSSLIPCSVIVENESHSTISLQNVVLSYVQDDIWTSQGISTKLVKISFLIEKMDQQKFWAKIYKNNLEN